MNLYTNQFGALPGATTDDYAVDVNELLKLQEQLEASSPYTDMTSLYRPNGEPVPKTWSIFTEGEKVVIKGLEAARTDWTPLARRFQRELFDRVFPDQPWREGMVELLGTNLDGVAGLRSIDSRTVMARYREHVRGDDGPWVYSSKSQKED